MVGPSSRPKVGSRSGPDLGYSSVLESVLNFHWDVTGFGADPGRRH